ncbi:hypothetical protein N0V84_003063 [Fusarium piperis]|uniref:Uncharacterized protein n=1 Tax=Fusarium piperis TaxID=1435070 RepID=A0A9W8WI71_9HYPO|nr:hypothetical protein N0V84_003063 [Fusarium piperis]
MRRHFSTRDRERGERDFMARWRPSPLRESHLVSRVGPDVGATIGPAVPDSVRFRDGPRETRPEDRRRNTLEDQLSSLFRENWPATETTDEQPEDQADLGWWTFESLPRYTRARIVGPVGFRQDEGPLRRLPPPVQHPPTTTRSSTAEERRRRRDDFRNRAMANLERTERRLDRARQNRGVDGLGDRDRSLSPEVWDTLLTTLTPDPQPPSAGSSFASTVASQSAGASSSTPLTAPDPPHDTLADQACESGCENSDTESPDYEHPDFALIRRRRDALRRVRVRVPDYNLDGPVDGPISRGSGAVNSESSAARRRRSPDGPLPSGEDVTGNTAELDGPLNVAQQRPRHGWVGQLSVGNSDDEQVLERWGVTREDSTTSGNNTIVGDEDWMGMQRIVRSLARREDIPDEWWAEAGLSRNLPGDGPE